MCGDGCVKRVVQIATDYPILSRRCLPALAASLTRAQARVVRASVQSRMPFLLSAAPINDLFVPVSRELAGEGATLYQGVGSGIFLYPCSQVDRSTWAFSTRNDPQSAATCDGHLWLSLDQAQVYSALGERQSTLGGFHMEGSSRSGSLRRSEVGAACPKGTAPIPDEEQCQRASASLQLVYHGVTPASDSFKHPYGCYILDESCEADQSLCGVWFNTDSSGPAQEVSSSICNSLDATVAWAAPASQSLSHRSFLDECTELRATEGTWVSVTSGQHVDDGPDVEAASAVPMDILDFTRGVTALQVSCSLLWRLGPIDAAPARRLTVRLPEVTGEIVLRADIVVCEGDFVVLEGALRTSDTNRATLVLGARQIRVESGGRLDLVRLGITGKSTGGSALFSEGRVAAINCSFTWNQAATNFIPRFAESLVPVGAEADKVRKGAFLATFGAAVFCLMATASFQSRGTSFENNAAISGRVANMGGAVLAVGGSMTVVSTLVSRNLAIGGRYAAQAGGVMTIFGPLVIDQSLFVGNEARQINGGFASGGAIVVQLSSVTVSAVRIERNVARGGAVGCAGGAFRIESRSAATFEDVLLVGNHASGGRTYSRGGAISMEMGSIATLSQTTFVKNHANSDASAFGGAISCDGELTIAPDVVFDQNQVLGLGRSSGGAIAVTSRGGLKAVGVKFVGQLVGPSRALRSLVDYRT